MTKKISVNWKTYLIDSSNLKNREMVDRKIKNWTNLRDHRGLGNNSKSNIHVIRVPEEKKQ